MSEPSDAMSRKKERSWRENRSPQAPQPTDGNFQRCACDAEKRVRPLHRTEPHRPYRKNIEAVCRNDTGIRHEVRQTVLHELKHYFGMDESQLKGV